MRCRCGKYHSTVKIRSRCVERWENREVYHVATPVRSRCVEKWENREVYHVATPVRSRCVERWENKEVYHVATPVRSRCVERWEIREVCHVATSVRSRCVERWENREVCHVATQVRSRCIERWENREVCHVATQVRSRCIERWENKEVCHVATPVRSRCVERWENREVCHVATPVRSRCIERWENREVCHVATPVRSRCIERWENKEVYHVATQLLIMSEPPTKINEPFAFGSDDEDFSLMNKEWSKVDGGLKNAGIREAMESSQNHILQDGFNSAFQNALQMAMSAGKLQGSISAILSYQPPAVKSHAGEHQENNLQMSAQTQLHELLAKSTSLLTGIPEILEQSGHSGVFYGQSQITKTATTYLGAAATDSVPLSTQTVTPCSELNDGQRDKPGKGNQPAGASKSCEAVCSNKLHFWNQLESFKEQARPLGIFTGGD
ncbi:hypothetical protein RRG08_009019 [Elysia crispata]|uniref:Uncharacterized protein n=1 Tax=Elysia crispata TaxID=231223 RepID=A0AAE1DZ45_9GAST|nr:hypothetical protein RRG08_009019 [Elysia crispata]